jgi:hypothetical protein
VVGTYQGVYHRWQRSPGTHWSPGWTGLGGFLDSAPVVATNQDGRLELFAGGEAGTYARHVWQVAPNGSWSNWALVNDRLVTSAANEPYEAGPNADGRLEVFSIDRNGVPVRHTWQTCPGCGFLNQWPNIGGSDLAILSIELARHADGRLELFAEPASGSGIVHAWQTRPNGSWSGWAEL